MIPTPPLVVPDSSVVALWLLANQRGANEALALREAYLAGQVLLALPELVLYELGGMFQLVAELDPETITAFLGQLMQLDIPLIAPDPAHLGRCVALARETGLGAYDAVFATLAVDLEGTWITADAHALAGLPADFPALPLEEWPQVL